MLRILVAASHPPAWGHGVARRPIRTQLGAPNRRASGPLFLPPSTRPSRGPPRRLTVVPLIGDKRYYGESPVRLRRCARAVGDAVPHFTPKTAKNPRLPHERHNRIRLPDQHWEHTRVTPGCHLRRTFGPGRT